MRVSVNPGGTDAALKGADGTMKLRKARQEKNALFQDSGTPSE
jgi:hypothetical protein